MPLPLADRIAGHLVATIERTPLARRPFRHINFVDAFPADVYADMLQALPPADLYAADNMTKYGRADGRCSRSVLDIVARLPQLPADARELWTGVAEALGATDVRRALCRKLEVAERGTSVTRLVHDLPGYWIEPHPDSRAKHITMQFYLARNDQHPELGTTLYRLRPLRAAVLMGRAPVMQRVGQFPFHPNTGYAFGVRWNSFHGVERIAEASGERHTLMNIYYHVPPASHPTR